MSTILLSLLSPDATYKDRKVSKISFPGKSGSFSVLPGHAPMIAALTEGDLVITIEDREERVHIKAGIVEVNRDKVAVCFDR